MAKKMIYLVAAAVFVLNLSMAEAAAPPTTISHQGYLTDLSGNAINSTLNIKVEFYDAVTDGTLLYTEIHSNVNVSNGQFNLTLGDGITSDTWSTDVAFSQALWFALTINPSGSNEPFTSRIPLTPAPYARMALAVSDGTVDNSVIGGTAPAAGTFTTVIGESATLTLGKSGTTAQGTIILHDNQSGDNYTTTLQAAATISSSSKTITLPDATGTVVLEPAVACASGKVLKSDGSSNWTCEDDATGGAVALISAASRLSPATG